MTFTWETYILSFLDFSDQRPLKVLTQLWLPGFKQSKIRVLNWGTIHSCKYLPQGGARLLIAKIWSVKKLYFCKFIIAITYSCLDLGAKGMAVLFNLYLLNSTTYKADGKKGTYLLTHSFVETFFKDVLVFILTLSLWIGISDTNCVFK